MVTIYEVKTGRPLSVPFMIDAREAVQGGNYTFTIPVGPSAVVPEKSERIAPELSVDDDGDDDLGVVVNPFPEIKPSRGRKPLTKR